MHNVTFYGVESFPLSYIDKWSTYTMNVVSSLLMGLCLGLDKGKLSRFSCKNLQIIRKKSIEF